MRRLEGVNGSASGRTDWREGPIKDVRVACGFSRFGCDPDEISDRLGLAPNEIRRKGEKRALANGGVFEVPFSAWSIESRSASKDVNGHLRELLARLKGTHSRILPQWGAPIRIFYMVTLSNTELENRRPVWIALSELFLDTTLDAHDIERITLALARSPYTLDELTRVLLWEVYPACRANLV